MLSRARLASARALRVSSGTFTCAAPAPVPVPASSSAAQAASVCAPWRSPGGVLAELLESRGGEGLSTFAQTCRPTALSDAALWRPAAGSQLIWRRQFSAAQSQSQSQSQSQEEQGQKPSEEDAAPAQEGGGAEAKESTDASLGDAKDKEIASLKERLLLAYADMENLRERMRRENDNLKLYAIQGFAKSLLDVADNLGRACSSAAAAMEDGDVEASAQRLKNLLEGVQATEKQLLKSFKTHGLEKISPAGELFDPNQHEAMFEAEDPSKEPGTVIQVLKEGYSLHGRVLRAAEVGVSRKTEG